MSRLRSRNDGIAPQMISMPPIRQPRALHAFTVDVEDYFQVSAFERCVSRDRWDDYSSRVEINTHKILAILAEHQVQGTFFILGWVAERYPQLVREISRAGHEVGSHGYWHRLIYSQTPTEFREDLRRSIDILKDIVGQPITAYRAPSFSITQKSRWATEILIEEGMLVDSSVMPVHHDVYGIPGAQAGLHRLETPAGSIWEFPPAVYRFLGMMSLPVGGGGYFRLYPFQFTRWCLRRLEKQRRPLMFYIHPWEVDPDQPRLPAYFKSRFRHYQNLRHTHGKLDRLLKSFRFGPICGVLAEQAGGPSIARECAPCLKP
jgi:polysaccharide deacetylase family protein (PEP-CTERM system associated)